MSKTRLRGKVNRKLEKIYMTEDIECPMLNNKIPFDYLCLVVGRM